MSETVLRSFVVRLGFRLDSQGKRNFDEAMKSTSSRAADIVKAFAKIAGSIAAGTGAAGIALQKVSEGLAGLAYSAQRTGSSAKELKVLEYGFQQVGLSAEDARGSVEALAAARRQNPGLNGLLAGLGVNPNQVDNAKVLVDLLGKLRGMQPFMRAQYAQMFGLNEGTINQLELNGPAFAAALKRREELFRREGYNVDAAAKKAVEFERVWNDAKARYGDMFQEMAVKLLPLAERFIVLLEKTADWLLKTDKATGGWVTRLGAVGMAIAPILAALKLSGGLGMLGKGLGALFGGGAATAAVGGAEAAGGGFLATVGLPAIIIAAVGAALVWMATHPEQVRKAASAAWNWTKDQAHSFAENAKGAVQAAKDSGGWVKALQTQPGFIGDLARMVGKFEGFRDKVYKDIAGNKTFGFGHKVNPGEDMRGVNPVSLFMADLQKSLWAVARNVKVRLTDNQRKALADLEFNIGEKNFKDSTLVRMLNQGKYDAAAEQFAHWNRITMNGHKVANETLSQRRAAESQLFRTPDSKTLNLQTKITVEGGGNARDTAREVGHEQKRVYSDIVRNFTPLHQ